MVLEITLSKTTVDYYVGTMLTREAADCEKIFVTRIALLARTVKNLSRSVVTQSTIISPTYSDTGNVNQYSAEGESLAKVQKTKKRKKKKAGEISTSRKSSTTHTVRNDGVESERDRSHLTDAEYAQPAAEDTTSLRFVQPFTRRQDRASTTPGNIFQPPPPSFEVSLDDDSWKTISSKRPEPKKKVLFVGNLRSDVTEAGLKTFIAQHLSTSSPSMTVAISQCSLFEKEQFTSVVVVNAWSMRDISILLDKRFWSRPVYRRSWNFGKYSSKDKADSDMETDESPAHRLRAVSVQISATEKQYDEEENARRKTNVLHDALASSMPNASPPK